MTVQTTDPKTNGVYQPTRREVSFTQIIGPDEAKRILTEMHYDHQRPFRPQWVRDYAAAMIDGSFEELTPIRIAIYQGRYFLLDGQHRLRAVVQTGIPVLFSVVQQEVESAERMRQIYSRIDRGGRRTTRDIYTTYDLQEEFDMKDTPVKWLGQAINLMLSGCMEKRELKNFDPVIKGMRIYAPQMITYQGITAKGNAQRGAMNAAAGRASTVAVALLSLRFAAPKAEKEGRPSVADFWTDVFLDDGLKLGDPRKVANKHLIETRIRSTAGGMKSVSVAYSARYLAACFNAHMEGRSLKMTKVFDERAPIDIYGVPSDPARWW